ncbi:MAG TPA: aldolase/citrate lyase family protein [Dehalococcoidales bacterium]|nr:aldolase/citrate lyase family protein [Dehalococcoidales bacterium]
MTNFKTRLREGQTVIGPFMKFSYPGLVEIFGNAGFDFVIIDTEHGPQGAETVETLVRAAELVGITPVVRVRRNEPSLISQALDLGAEGLLVPQVTSEQDALDVVKAAKFEPEGGRGVCCYVRAAAYSHENKFDYFKRANANNVTIIMIEGRQGIDNLDQIIKVPGVDVIFIGPYDLSQSLGLPGQVDHPLVIEKMREVAEKAQKAGLAVGTFVDNLEAAARWSRLGVQFIAYSVDTGIIYQAARDIVARLKENIGSAR